MPLRQSNDSKNALPAHARKLIYRMLATGSASAQAMQIFFNKFKLLRGVINSRPKNRRRDSGHGDVKCKFSVFFWIRCRKSMRQKKD
jgi:hypothetical protein